MLIDMEDDADNWKHIGTAARDLVAKLKVTGGEISGAGRSDRCPGGGAANDAQGPMDAQARTMEEGAGTAQAAAIPAGAQSAEGETVLRAAAPSIENRDAPGRPGKAAGGGQPAGRDVDLLRIAYADDAGSCEFAAVGSRAAGLLIAPPLQGGPAVPLGFAQCDGA